MRKSFFALILIFFLLLSTTTAHAASNAVPLVQLSAIGRLSLAIGLSEDEIQAELAAGKTLKQIAEANGMPDSMFNKRIVNADFSHSISTVTVHKKITKQVVKKTPKKIAKKPVKKTYQIAKK